MVPSMVLKYRDHYTYIFCEGRVQNFIFRPSEKKSVINHYDITCNIIVPLLVAILSIKSVHSPIHVEKYYSNYYT